MRGAFFGLNIAVSGLYTAQRNLDIVNHNLSNVNTPGYSRQYGVQSASKPAPLYDGTGMVGTGSDITAVNRTRDEYLDYKYWAESTFEGEWGTKEALLTDLEAAFNEPSSDGFTQIMNDFYNSLQELSKDPSSASVRALVRQRGITLTKYYNNMAIHLEELQHDINGNVNSKVDEINSLATQIQQLNRQVYIAEIDGNTAANDMRDERTVLVDRLSKIINIDANEVVVGKLPNGRDNKHFVVTISGKALVDHYNLSKLKTVHRKDKLNNEDVGGLYEVSWEDGNTIDIRGGELKGYLDTRDGNNGQAALPTYAGPLKSSAAYKGLPYYQARLNEFVRNFAQSFNEGYANSTGSFNGHRDGMGANGSVGKAFFTVTDTSGNALDTATFGTDYSQVTARFFSVSKDVLGDINAIAAADPANPTGAANTDILTDLMKMRHDPHLFVEGSPEEYMKSTIATLGIDAQFAERIGKHHTSVIQHIENQRIAVSGVSIDEEMANLVKHQHAYNASAKMITTMAEVYDTLINKMGVR
jgi:flagellar hook-associated protein 1